MSREYIDGATAIARAAIDAGCTFFAGYPITPATPILLHMVRELPKVGGIALEAEDEIAAISMCIGATFSGARAMTATSGPGISLYSENIGLAIMTEAPLVIVDVQRMGPATGGATTGAQGDIQFLRWGTSGGYPLIVLSPSSVAEAYTLTLRAFDLAERFRVPVILATDKELVASMTTVDLDAYQRVPVRERTLAPPPAPGYRDPRWRPEETFLPWDFDPVDRVPPMAHYGGPHILRVTGSSHDEHGFLTKDPAKVGRLNEHLWRKIMDHREETELGVYQADEGADVLWIAYGTPARAMREAAARARAQGIPLRTLILHTLWPVPENLLTQALRGVRRVVIAELNLGQYTREVERLAYREAAKAGTPPPEIVGIHRVDGEPITPEQFLDE
ncbi:MAG: pyruvate flavodoxin/ferredoxin oxidoreductase [Chloroflexi bacterium]|nr:pyruvate flavodoxin/ferredoxin oxidoreductase [Chloroflexota bacterium]